MEISEEEYRRILSRQKSGDLTVFIYTSGFRRLLLEKIDTGKLSRAIDQPIESHVSILRAIWFLDMLMPLVTAVLAVVAFSWWGILGGLLAFAARGVYKTHASRGEQHILPMTLFLLTAVALATFLPLLDIWSRILIVSFVFMLFIDRLLYFFTSKFVFDLINSNYKFFSMFYTKLQSNR